jgi:ribose transport system ATP-binding protein
MEEKGNILELKNITKTFPGVVALDRIDLNIEQGEIHVLVGENGAGKSCLIKILCGIYIPDSGEIVYAGSGYAPRNPTDAIRAGIRVVYQEFNLLSYLSVAENIFFEKLPQNAGFVDFRRLYRETEKLLEMVGLDISPKTPVELLGVAQMQLIEIAKALSSKSKVLILDEPTATLTSKEIDTLFKIIKRLKQEGVTIIYISHRLQEIYSIGDRITVLRNGQKVETTSIHDVTIPDIVKMMVGRSMHEEYPFNEEIKPQEVILKVEDLRYRGNPHAITFSLKKGELLGIAGLVGSGRTETMRAIFGADRKEAGSIYVGGSKITIRHPRDAIQHHCCPK